MLPPEVWTIICSQLSQFDLCSLLLVNKELSDIALAQLYCSIIVDSHYTQFDPEYVQTNRLFQTRKTFIRTKPNINGFLHSSKVAKVKCLEIVHCPQEFIDFELKLSKSLASFTSLAALRIDQPVSLDLLENIHSNLDHLSLAINNFRPCRLQFAPLCLKSISIGPSSQPNDLTSALVQDTSKLQALELVRPHRKIHLRDLISSSIRYPRTVLDFPAVSHLSLVSAILTPQDSIPLAVQNNLKSICFADTNEIAESESLLDTLNPPKLEILAIDLRQGSIDSVAPFLNRLSPNSLRELSLVIRYNILKQSPLMQLLDQYVAAISRQSGSLEKLSLEIRSEKELVELHEQLSESQFSQLFMKQSFPRLSSLRIQTQFAFISKNKQSFFNCLPNLQKLWILGSNSFEKHWGLGNAYPGVFDNWLRIQHLPTGLLNDAPKPNTKLEYIKIDECLFQIKKEQDVYEIVPRDSIDSWFESHTDVRWNPRLWSSEILMVDS
ncbi:hypothetical protein OGAPHI_001590 [Ogataea philodendri]|uniref:F-box domain-containing protein n=1 Tax=Ogataea philodendri TaxID=1378263 RepID=A0A9P8T8F2_9ASCO|nr:uncharacterized protein OGAPHI_001590 [Ogataea philodendri]KAH3669469.1 hypothetical protein OGAPHI_001590 [Ogataea philodendri]